jgi:hypothetical protein
MAVPEYSVESLVEPSDVLMRIETFDDPRAEMMVAFHRATHLDAVDYGTGQEVVTYAALLRDFVTRRTTEVMPHSSLETYAVDERWFDRVASLNLQFLLAPAVAALERTVNGASALRAEAAKSEEILHLFEDENAQLIEDLRAEAEERVPERLVFGHLELELTISATTDAFVGDNPHTGQPSVCGTELARTLRKLADSIDTIPGRRLQGKSWTLYDLPGRPVGKAQALAIDARD